MSWARMRSHGLDKYDVLRLLSGGVVCSCSAASLPMLASTYSSSVIRLVRCTALVRRTGLGRFVPSSLAHSLCRRRRLASNGGCGFHRLRPAAEASLVRRRVERPARVILVPRFRKKKRGQATRGCSNLQPSGFHIAISQPSPLPTGLGGSWGFPSSRTHWTRRHTHFLRPLVDLVHGRPSPGCPRGGRIGLPWTIDPCDQSSSPI